MKREKRVRWVLAAVLVALALWAEQLPTIGGKCMVRAAVVQLGADKVTLGLLCQQADAAADAAEAQEQMQLYVGEGATLAQAYAQAESKMAGQAMYKLCDTLLVSGQATLAALPQLAGQWYTSGKGRLSARVVYTETPLAELTEAAQEDAEATALFSAIGQAGQAAPRLYQAARQSVCLPQLAGQSQELTRQGAVMLAENGALLHLTLHEQAAAALLQRGWGRLTFAQGELTIRATVLVSRVLDDQNQVGFRLYVQLYGLPEQPAARSAARQAALAQIEGWCSAAWDKNSRAGGEWIDVSAFAALYRGSPLVRAGAGQSRVQTVWAAAG